MVLWEIIHFRAIKWVCQALHFMLCVRILPWQRVFQNGAPSLAKDGWDGPLLPIELRVVPQGGHLSFSSPPIWLRGPVPRFWPRCGGGDRPRLWSSQDTPGCVPRDASQWCCNAGRSVQVNDWHNGVGPQRVEVEHLPGVGRAQWEQHLTSTPSGGRQWLVEGGWGGLRV